MRILATGYGNGTIIFVRTVASSILVTQNFQFPETSVPVRMFLLFVIVTWCTNTVFHKRDARSGIRHQAFFTISHMCVSLKLLNYFCFKHSICEALTPRTKHFMPTCQCLLQIGLTLQKIKYLPLFLTYPTLGAFPAFSFCCCRISFRS